MSYMESLVDGALVPHFNMREPNLSGDVAVGSIAANGANVTVPLDGYNGFSVQFSGTFSGINVAFEASMDGGTTWVAVNAVASNGSAAVASVAPSNPSAYDAYAPGATHARVRATSFTSGSLAVRLVPTVMAQDPSPVAFITGSLPAGSNVIGTVNVEPKNTTGACSVSRLVAAAATTNASVVKASAGRVFKVRGYNASTSVRYLKFYAKATAPTVGTDVPVLTFALKPSDIFDIDLLPWGHYIANGISFALTTGALDSDTGALTANDVTGLQVFYV